MYGRATQTAIAAISRLAEVYDGGRTRLGASDIAAERQLQKPFVSKLLSVLANAGLVAGSRGPGGGFTLTRDPASIRLLDVFELFDREDESLACPFGGGECGVGDPCPIHDKLVEVQVSMDKLLRETTFEVFREAHQEQNRRATRSKGRKGASRESYRAAATRRSGKAGT